VDASISRSFQFDYVIFDALFLLIFVVCLFRQRRFAALLSGLFAAVVFYAVDAVFWTRYGIREYSISEAWMRPPLDFMMDVSYGIITFGWLWVILERRSTRDVLFWTLLVFGGWLLVPLLSFSIPLRDDAVLTVRHMQGQLSYHVLIVAVGYLLLAILKYPLSTILYVFWAGCMLSFMMEASLMVSGIRPWNPVLLGYETLFLYNLGVPFFFVFFDKVFVARSAGPASAALSRRPG